MLAPACAPIAAYKISQPGYHPVNGAASVAEARQALARDPERALGDYLDAARSAELALKSKPHDDTARKDYNFAVGRAVEAMARCKLSEANPPITVPSRTGNYVVSAKLPANTSFKLRDFDFYASDSLEVGGKYFAERDLVDGLGAPFAAFSKTENKDFRKSFGWKREFGSTTALIHFTGPMGRRAEVQFHLPLHEDEVTLNGVTYPLAADFNAPLVILMAQERPERLGLRRMLQPEKYADTARLVRLQAYDPDRIPVLFVHGLQDTPASWAPMINALRADPEIRERYQFWIFSYPSGYPYPYSASLLRKELDGVDKVFPNHKPIVLVGHSMGGVISRLMITDSGDKIWRDLFGHPPAETHLAGPSRELMEQAVIFEHRRDVGRVIFLSAPHRGSDFATNWIGRLGSSLVNPPRFLANMTGKVTSLLTLDRSALKLNRMPNSIDTLSPKNRFVRSVNKLPITPGIPYHTIVGDRGRGDTPDSSDGVVAYWSSHLDGAQSELVVPSNHGTPRNPQAIQEVRRILKVNLKR
jgi:pimeloyl-ACP methyl ester carboxylesterase